MKLTRRDLLKWGTVTSLAIVSSGIQAAEALNDMRTFTFEHGVASGDPLEDSVIIWSRVTPSESGVLRVIWEVATDASFQHLVNQDSAIISQARDYTVKVDIRSLSPNTTYYYRFKAGHTISEIGQTKTLPSKYATIDQLKMAVFSCCNYSEGYFNVLAAAALREDLDVALHLGDYIYEYGRPAETDPLDLQRDEITAKRAALPSNELLTLEDYRTRYAQYRTDKDLQTVHAKLPFIVVWDDHEIADDVYKIGAENHDDIREGGFELRKQAAIQAYFEWLPLRPIEPDAEGKIYRQFEFGNLVNLMMLDTRVIGRDKQLAYMDYADAATGKLDVPQFLADMKSDRRSILGQKQLDWLTQTMTQSSATWQVLGQQVLMTKMWLPEVTLREAWHERRVTFGEYTQISRTALIFKALVENGINAADDLALLQAGLTQAQIDIVRDPVKMAYLESPFLPYNLDAWDGYEYDRERVLSTAWSNAKNLIALSGDSHNAWCGNLTDRNGNLVGIEFATSSVSSPGLEAHFNIKDAQRARSVEDEVSTLVNDLNYCNIRERGYLVVTYTAQQAQAEWLFVDTVKSKNYVVDSSLTKVISHVL